MALLSDVDWIIILAVGAFLLLGQQSGDVMRTVGRYYGRFLRIKQDVLSELTRAADLPVLATGATPSIRNTFLAAVEPLPASAHIPLAVSTPPSTPVAAVVAGTGMGGGIGDARWIVASPPVSNPPRGDP